MESHIYTRQIGNRQKKETSINKQNRKQQKKTTKYAI